MDSTEHALEALPSGVLFADWIRQRGCAKSTAYRMRGELGIQPERRRRGGLVEVWLTAEQEELLTTYADALARGLSTTEALAAVGRPVESDGPCGIVHVGGDEVDELPPQADPVESDGQVRRLRHRLAALRDAVELGAPLTTAEAEILLGAKPGGMEVVRGRVRGVRLGRNHWVLEPD